MVQYIDEVVRWSPYAGMVGLAVALVMVCIRLIIGPHFADRIIALDTITYLAIGFCAVWALVTGHDEFLAAAATLALISFLATVALSRWMIRRSRPEAQR
jgi:multicomponent Na+:H+ antiporter subunit F